MKVLTSQVMTFQAPLLPGDRRGQTGRPRDVNHPVSVRQPSPAQRMETRCAESSTGAPQARAVNRFGGIRSLKEPAELLCDLGMQRRTELLAERPLIRVNHLAFHASGHQQTNR